jgi:hypothetical protein
MLPDVMNLKVLRIFGSLSMKQKHQPQKQDRRVFVFDHRYKQKADKWLGHSLIRTSSK